MITGDIKNQIVEAIQRIRDAAGPPMERRVFPEGRDRKGYAYEDYRWSRFKHFAPVDAVWNWTHAS